MTTPSLERISPKQLNLKNSFDAEILEIHIDRYAFASKNLIAGKILDLACGVGYGSFYLANSPKVSDAIIAVDIDNDAIAYAKENYAHLNISYHVGSAYDYAPPSSISNIISLETIEHLEYPEVFISHAASLLQSGNRFIISVPITPSMDFNPYHLHDFTSKSICILLEKNNFKLINFKIQVQPYKLKNIFVLRKSRTKINLKRLLLFYLKNPHKIVDRFLSLAKDGLANKYFIGVFEKNYN